MEAIEPEISKHDVKSIEYLRALKSGEVSIDDMQSLSLGFLQIRLIVVFVVLYDLRIEVVGLSA